MKIAIVLGTRPEIIKMSPVIRACERLRLDYFILHSGQHYSYSMDRIFFEQLRLPDAKYNLEAGSGTDAEQTGKVLVGVEKLVSLEDPDVVLVEGDTNTVLAAALASAKLGVKVGHVEAGLRSYDWRMPEEINRVLTDHCSDLLFAPTEKSRNILLGEGISSDKIFITGNTVVDAVTQHLALTTQGGDPLGDLNLSANNYFLVTLHRRENTDGPERLRRVLEGLRAVRREFNMPLICPVHPRTRKQLRALGHDVSEISLIEPLDYLRFLELERNARLILTDSGGVQEEACILRVPCVTLRSTTERPETLDVGANILAGTEPVEIVKSVHQMLTVSRDWENPFGDGTAGEKIVEITREHCS